MLQRLSTGLIWTRRTQKDVLKHGALVIERQKIEKAVSPVGK